MLRLLDFNEIFAVVSVFSKYFQVLYSWVTFYGLSTMLKSSILNYIY